MNSMTGKEMRMKMTKKKRIIKLVFEIPPFSFVKSSTLF